MHLTRADGQHELLPRNFVQRLRRAGGAAGTRADEIELRPQGRSGPLRLMRAALEREEREVA